MDILCCQMVGFRGSVDNGATLLPPPKNRLDGWKEFKHTLDWLKMGCPTAMPVVVRFALLPETMLGNCTRRERRFVIKLNDRMGEHQACDVLVHEWSHAMAWSLSLDALANRKDTNPAEFELLCHDETWGCAYSRAWRVYTQSLAAYDHKRGVSQ